MKRKITRNSLLIRMLAIFLLAILPLYAIGISLYTSAIGQLHKETIRNKQDQMAYYVRLMENELMRLTYLCTSVLNGSTIGTVANRYSFLSDYQKSVQVNALRDDLRTLCLSSQYPDTATAYMLPLGRSLNDYRGLETLEEEDLALCNALADTRGVTNYQDGALHIVSAVRDSAYQPVYLLDVRLKPFTFKQDMRQLAGNAHCALVYEPTGEEIAASSTQASGLWAQLRADGSEIPTGGTPSPLLLDGASYHVVQVSAPSTALCLYAFLPEQELYRAASQYQPYQIAFALATLALLAVLLPSLVNMVHKPLRQLRAAFEKMETGDMSVRIAHHRKDEFRQVYQGFNHMADTLDRYINRTLQQELLLRRAELLQLQSQINPHFLYNSYFMLHRMIKRQDWEESLRFSRYMGQYFRFITRNAPRWASLAEEVEHARIYAQIQAMRFDGRIAVDFASLPEPLQGLQTPRLILQPLLENAFEHGLKETIAGGLVRVSFAETAAGCDICVEDNGGTLSGEALSALRASLGAVEGEITALKNIHRRLLIAMPQTGGLELTRSALGGLCVCVHLSAAGETGEEGAHEPADCGR